MTPFMRCAILDNDGVSDERLTIASGLDNPHGVAWHDGDLYIGEIPRIRVARNILQQLKNPSQPPPNRGVYRGIADRQSPRFASY